MATPTVPTTNIGIYSSLRPATDCQQTTNLSLASICSGDTYGGITNTFGGQGGPAAQFDVGLGEYLGLEDPPMEMSNTIGGGYS